MKGAEVKFNTGDVLRTSINGTDAEIKDYYRKGRWFNLGGKRDPTKDRMAKVVSCKVLKDDAPKKRSGTFAKKVVSSKKYRFVFDSPRGKGFVSVVSATTQTAAKQKFYGSHPMAKNVKVK
jgi:hypothetical protein